MNELVRRLREVLARPGERLPGWLAPVTHPLRFLWILGRELERDHAFGQAGAMAYATLVALVPILLLVTGVLEVAGFVDQDPAAVRSLLFDSFLGDIPEVRQLLLPGLVGVDLRALGIVGVVGLMVTGWRLYVLIEDAYAGIFGVEVKRSTQQRILLFYVGVTVVPVLFVNAFLYAWRASAAVGMSDVAAVVAEGVVLFGAIRYFPNTHVRVGPAALGATVTVALVQATHALFGLYLRVFSVNDPVRVVYGSLAALPMFLLWLWLLWVVVLVGVEAAAVSQDFPTLIALHADEARATPGPHPTVGLDVALLALAVVAARFERGEGGAATGHVAAEVGVPPKVMLPVLEALEQAGYLASSDDGWLPVRPPEQTSLVDVAVRWRRIEAPTLAEHPRHQRVAADLDAGLPGTLADGVARWLAPDGMEPGRSGD